MSSKASLPVYTIVARWTVNDVCNWLMENKFSNFVPMFRESGVDGCRLASIGDLDLRKMKCPNSKSLDLLRCIDNIPGKDEARNRRPPAAAPAINHRPPPSLPQTKPQNGSLDDDDDADDFSEPDDDYEWNDFDEQPSSDSGSDMDYENNPDRQKPPSMQPAPKKSGSGSDYDKPDVPPPRPSRPGQSGGSRLPPPFPKTETSSPSPGRRGRQPAPIPVPEPEQPDYVETDIPGLEQPSYFETSTQHFEQPDYEDPNANEAPPPSVPQRPGVRLPQALPPRPGPGGRKTAPSIKPPQEPEETYDIPEEDQRPPRRPDIKKIPTAKGVRGKQPLPEPTPPPPMDEPQELYEDPDAPSSEPSADDVYEDPDQHNEPTPSRPSLPKHNVPKPVSGRGKPPPLPVNRKDSQPETPAPPVPRHHQKRGAAMLPPRGKPAPTPESDDDQDDYEKPAQDSRPLPPRSGKDVPNLNDLPSYMEMAPKEPEEAQEDYEVPDPDLAKAAAPVPPRPKRDIPPLPSEPEEKEKPKQPYIPVGAVPLLPSPVINGTPSKSETDGKGALSGEINAPPRQVLPRPKPRPRPRSPATSEETIKHRKLPPEPHSKPDPPSHSSETKSPTHRQGSVLSRPLPSKPTSEDEHIKDFAWFHDVTRQVADRELQKHSKSGMFLVRRSTKPGQPYTLVIFNQTNIYNLPIRKREDGQFALGKFKKDENAYDHVADLIEFFKTHTLILAAGGSQTRLKHSLPR